MCLSLFDLEDSESLQHKVLSLKVRNLLIEKSSVDSLLDYLSMPMNELLKVKKITDDECAIIPRIAGTYGRIFVAYLAHNISNNCPLYDDRYLQLLESLPNSMLVLLMKSTKLPEVIRALWKNYYMDFVGSIGTSQHTTIILESSHKQICYIMRLCIDNGKYEDYRQALELTRHQRELYTLSWWSIYGDLFIHKRAQKTTKDHTGETLTYITPRGRFVYESIFRETITCENELEALHTIIVERLIRFSRLVGVQNKIYTITQEDLNWSLRSILRDSCLDVKSICDSLRNVNESLNNALSSMEYE